MANLSSLFENKAFNPSSVEEMEGGFDTVPKGEYKIHITESEVMPNKSGTGTNLTLKLVIQDGKFRNRVLFDNLCVVHQNPTAQAIAQSRLKQMCDALGIKALKDSSQLHDKPITACVSVELDKYQTERNGVETFRNNIRSYGAAAAAEAAVNIDEDMPF